MQQLGFILENYAGTWETQEWQYALKQSDELQYSQSIKSNKKIHYH